jgi:hypothetical protein
MYANFEQAFDQKVKNININQTNNLHNEKKYIENSEKANNQFSKYQNTNYIINIEGKNIEIDDQLTRGNFYTKPLDKLSSKVDTNRYIMPSLYKCVDNNHDKFLTSTNLSCNPQKKFNTEFNIQGISTSNYNRKNYK